MLKIVFLVALIVELTSGTNSMVGNFQQCSLQCSNNIRAPVSTNPRSPRHLIPGKSGPRGAKGDRGMKGDVGTSCDVIELKKLAIRLSELESDIMKQRNASQEDVSRLERKVDLVAGKLNASQKEVVRLKEYVTILNGKMNVSVGNIERKLNVTNQLNETLQEEVTGLKTELTTLNGTLVEMEESVKPPGRTCKHLLDNNNQYNNGVYTIIRNDTTTFDTYCDMDAGGYIVFQRRFDGSTDFHQNLQNFTDGFGSVNAEYWLGLENLHQLTKTGRWQLRVELMDYEQDTAFALYDDFSIGAAPGYRLNIGAYGDTSTAGDSLGYHSGSDFTTYDRDADEISYYNCAVQFEGAWWHKDCHYVNINANYNGTGVNGMMWLAFKGTKPMQATTMMIREI